MDSMDSIGRIGFHCAKKLKHHWEYHLASCTSRDTLFFGAFKSLQSVPEELKKCSVSIIRHLICSQTLGYLWTKHRNSQSMWQWLHDLLPIITAYTIETSVNSLPSCESLWHIRWSTSRPSCCKCSSSPDVCTIKTHVFSTSSHPDAENCAFLHLHLIDSLHDLHLVPLGQLVHACHRKSNEKRTRTKRTTAKLKVPQSGEPSLVGPWLLRNYSQSTCWPNDFMATYAGSIWKINVQKFKRHDCFFSLDGSAIWVWQGG